VTLFPIEAMCSAPITTTAGAGSRPAPRSPVFGCQYEGANANGLARVGRVFAPHVAPGDEAGPVVSLEAPPIFGPKWLLRFP
jgi:hypothetical protein